jgi:hypothetical protein
MTVSLTERLWGGLETLRVEEGSRMHNTRVGVGWWLLGLVLGLAPLLGGCSDPSRQTGTQVQVSEETKAQIQDMRDMYKDMGKTKKK